MIEHVLVSDFEEYKTKPSQLLHGHTLHYDVFHCPRCHTIMPRPEHGVLCKCPECNLEMLVYGNGMEISNTPGEIQPHYHAPSLPSRKRSLWERLLG